MKSASLNARASWSAASLRRFWILTALTIFFALPPSPAAADAPKKAQDIKVSKTKDDTENTNSPVYIEYMKLLAADDAAEKEIDRWIKDAEAFEAAGDKSAKLTLQGRVKQRFDLVKVAYQNFVDRHPKHAEARLAFGSFLMDIGEEEQAVTQMEKGKDLDPTNPAAWNNLANHYGHRSPVKKAFEYYAKAIELDPSESTYVWNLATTTYLFRKDAREFYKIEEQEVFDRALKLYNQALKLDPTNLVLAVDLAQSYYGIKPMRTNDALTSWTNSLAIAKTTDEQQGIYLHLARVELNTGHFEEARHHLTLVTNKEMMDLKTRLERNLREKESKSTNIVDSP